MSIPSSIDRTGSTNVAGAVQSFIDSTPDGSVIVFPPGTYRMDRTVFVSGRANLVFEGAGAILRGSGNGTSVWNSGFLIDGANSDIAVRGFTVEGSNPRTRNGTDPYDRNAESTHGIGIYGGTRIEVSEVTTRHTHGDGIYIADKDTTGTWATDVWVHDSRVELTGRNAFTVNAARRLLIERVTVDRAGGAVFHIEPDRNDQGIAGAVVRANTVLLYGISPQFTHHFASAANQTTATSASISGLTYAGNLVTGGPGLRTWIGRPSRMSNVTFSDNRSTVAMAGPVLTFENIDGLRITGNTQPLTSGSLFSITNSTDVVMQP